MVDDLEVPEVLARVGIHRNKAGGEQVVSGAVATILVNGRGAEGEVDDTALVIDRDMAPNVHASAIDPAVFGPGVVIFFACLGNRVKLPGDFAGAHIPGTDVASGAQGRIFLRSATGNDKVLEDDGRGGEAIDTGKTSHDVFGVHVHDAVVTEGHVGFARFGVNGVHLAVAGAENDLRGSLTVTRPVFDATGCRAAGGELVVPQFLPGHRVNGNKALVRRRNIHDAINNEGSVLRG